MKSVEVKELGAEIEFKLNFAVFYDFFLTVQPKKRFFFAVDEKQTCYFLHRILIILH